MIQDEVQSGGPLKEISEEDLRTLLACSRRVSCRTDQVVLQQGQHNGSLFFVQNGILHVRRYAEGREVLLGRLEAGGFFGDVSLFDPGPTTAAVVAVSPAELIEVRGEDLRRFIETRPAAAARFLSGLLKEMANRLRRTDERLVEAIFWGGLLK
jgi:CRP-like cAMP-binding protein